MHVAKSESGLISSSDEIGESIVRRASCAVVLASAAACLLSQAAEAAHGDGRPGVSSTSTSRAIATAWQRREARAQRFHAEWIHERTYTKYWANCHVPFARDEYVTLRFASSRLTLDGDRLRFDCGAVVDGGEELSFDGRPIYDRHGRGAHDDAQRVFRDDRIRYDAGRPRVDPREPPATDWPRNLRPFTTVFDGQRNLQFLTADHGREPEAYWFDGAENRFRTSLHYLPLLLAVHPSWLGVAPEACRLEWASESIQGRECCILIEDNDLRREFWLDPEREFIVLSYREDCDVLGARMKNRIDITYCEDEAGNWLPSAWTTVFFDNHGLMEQYAPATVLATTTDAEINGEVLAVAFPEKTWVYDEASAEHHIIGTDGRAQRITSAELREGLSHADLIARESWSGQAGRAIRAAWRQTWLRFVVFLVLFGGISVWLQRRHVNPAS